jgi:hypothetical protein
MEADLTYTQMARSAYRAYTINVVGRNHQGMPLPTWDDLPVHRRVAWECVVRQVEICLLSPETAEAMEGSWQGWVPDAAEEA